MSRGMASILVAALLIWISGANAQPPADEPVLANTPVAGLLAAGNQAYDAGDCGAAIEHYRAIEQQGVSNGYVLYNLGNAYQKCGDLGRAILSYEKAARLIPRNQDLQGNLAYLKVLKRDKDPQSEASKLVGFVQALVHGVTLREVSTGALVLWFLLFALVIGRVLTRPGSPAKKPLAFAAIPVLVLFLGALSHWSYLAYQHSKPRAIVVAEEVAIRSGPSLDDVTEFKLHAGTEVEIGRRTGGWVQVGLSEELRGWCEESTIEAF